MVKLFCNRCGKEIKDRYHTINIYSYDTNPKDVDYATADCATSGYGRYSEREGALAILNSIEMYCPECIEKIKDFITYGNSR